MPTKTKKPTKRSGNARSSVARGSASADARRLSWLCKFITEYGLNGVESIAWSAYGENGETLMRRKAVAEDEVGDVRFDRAALNRAMRGVRVPNTKPSRAESDAR